MYSYVYIYIYIHTCIGLAAIGLRQGHVEDVAVGDEPARLIIIIIISSRSSGSSSSSSSSSGIIFVIPGMRPISLPGMLPAKIFQGQFSRCVPLFSGTSLLKDNILAQG